MWPNKGYGIEQNMEGIVTSGGGVVIRVKVVSHIMLDTSTLLLFSDIFKILDFQL